MHSQFPKSSSPLLPSSTCTMRIPLLATLLFIVSATASPFNKCIEAGIDPYGPIPSDHTYTDGKSFHFSASSKGVLWLQAQNAPEFDRKKITRRELTGYSFATWSDNGGCTGSAVYYPEVYFNKYYWDYKNNADMKSFQIIVGQIKEGQRTIHLQHYVPGTQHCTAINMRVNGGPQCSPNLPTYTCFRVENW
ncbi:hypothetical protein BDD12DRAFT_867699 [Trichophaea hybrida]|nr:hypothetical protein BDD12DRAFT_867699 [Trichophaea hybrida]